MIHNKRIYYFASFVSLVILAVFLWLKFYQSNTFEQTATGLTYRIISKGKGPAPQEGEVILLNMHYQTEKGDTLLNTAAQDFPTALRYSDKTYTKDGSFLEAISMLQKGAKMLFKLDAKKLLGENFTPIAAQYGLKEDEKILLKLSLENIMSEQDFKKWKTDQIALLQKRQQEKDQQQLQEDTKAIDQYLKKRQLSAQTMPSGLRYVIDTPGQGAKPKQKDKVKVNYTGQLLNGKVFDTSLADIAKKHGIHNSLRTYEPMEFQLGVEQVIKGWDEGIMLLNKGAKARLFIPSALAYGSRAMGELIQPNAILIFDVELVDIQ